MHESQLNDKIKYWQYHLKKNKKGEVKEGVKKTPEKKKVGAKSMYLSNNTNSLSNTIDKLKSYLHQSELVKTADCNFKKEKQAKKVCNKDVEIVCKTSKSMSMQGTMKLKPSSKKSKNDVVIENKSKSKSKSKSKNKLLKLKKSKEVKTTKDSKQQVKITKLEKMLSPRKSNKKKKNKSPSKKIFSIKIEAAPLQQWQLEKRLLETVNLKTQRSRFQTETTNFRIWEEHEQTRYNQKRKHLKTFSTYFRSFLSFITHNSRFNTPRASFTDRMTSIPFNLSTMIRSQESKLLDLRRELNRLKDSTNLNESLELIINKVNQNISSLKKIEYSQKDEPIPPTTQLDTSYANNKILDQVNSFRSSHEAQSSHQTSFCSQPQVRQPILMMDSLMISNQSPQPCQKMFNNEDFKQESSINLLDSKFMNVTLNQTSMVQGEQAIDINLSLIKSHEKVLLSFQNHQSTLLLSASTQSKLLSETSQLDENIPCVQFTVNQVKFYPSAQEYITIKEDIESPPSEEENNTLLKSINSILNDHAKQLEIQRRDRSKSKYSSQQLNYLIELVFSELIIEILPFFGSHQSFLQRMFEFLSQLPQQDNEELTPIQSSNQYLFSLADSLLLYAEHNFKLRNRISQPLGVAPLVNLRYIRISLIDEYALDGFSPYNQQDYSNQIQQEMTQVEERADIITKDDLDTFDEKHGNQNISYQIILNRCLYQYLNNILDKFRPFGNTGIPTFYSFTHHYNLPSLAAIRMKVKDQLGKYMNTRLGCHLNNNLPAVEIQKQVIESLAQNQLLMRDEIQEDFQSDDEDSMERYQLMLMIENYIFSQECWVLSKRMRGEIAL